ncbi:MAG: DUF2238 domain-containing protein [Phycisphaerales bacterium]|nr:DUF2238 domain-containing protein [Phycisphaerales bacterium]
MPRCTRRISYRAALLAAVGAVVAITAVAPTSRSDFLIEHIPTAALLSLLIYHARARPLRNLSYTLIFVMLMLHAVGAHYLYSQVPYQRWGRSLLGEAVGDWLATPRNHYDRFVHAAFGLLMVIPAAEVAGRFAGIRPGFWAAVFGIGGVSLCANAYEALEWLFTFTVSPEAAADYNGQQGDIYDASKDVALSLAGSLLPAIWVVATAWPSRARPAVAPADASPPRPV